PSSPPPQARSSAQKYPAGSSSTTMGARSPRSRPGHGTPPRRMRLPKQGRRDILGRRRPRTANRRDRPMEWRGRRGSRNIEDRRGMGSAGAGGIGVVGMLVVLAAGYFFGVDISPLVGGLSEPQQTAPRELSAEEREIGQFVSVVLADTEEIWAEVLATQAGMDY